MTDLIKLYFIWVKIFIHEVGRYTSTGMFPELSCATLYIVSQVGLLLIHIKMIHVLKITLFIIRSLHRKLKCIWCTLISVKQI